MVSNQILRFGAQPIPLASVFPGACRRAEVEPLRSNSNPAWVGTAAMNGDGATGVIQELAAPAPGVALDRFVDHAAGDAHNAVPPRATFTAPPGKVAARHFGRFDGQG